MENRTSGISEKILEEALHFLMKWEEGAVTLDDYLDRLRNQNFAWRSAVASLLFEYFRHKFVIDSIIMKHAKKDAVGREMRLLVSCAATQIFYQTGIGKESAVNVAVELAKRLRGVGGGGFVNAMLRSFLRDGSIDEKFLSRKSLPPFLFKRWVEKFGEDKAREAEKCFAIDPPITFRVRDGVDEKLLPPNEKVKNLDFTGSFDFRTAKDRNALFESVLASDSSIYIQDPATSLAFSLLKERPKGRILDACAAPGGKTIMLYDVCDREQSIITASDKSPQRLLTLNQNLRRAGVRARSIQADAVSLPFSQGTFDFILADVPCCNTGVIRRRPDAPWRFTEESLLDTAKLQKDILFSLAKAVKRGGFILYSTCSVEDEEDGKNVRDFIKESGNVFALEGERLLLPCRAHDGAYSALLRKT